MPKQHDECKIHQWSRTYSRGDEHFSTIGEHSENEQEYFEWKLDFNSFVLNWNWNLTQNLNGD